MAIKVWLKNGTEILFPNGATVSTGGMAQGSYVFDKDDKPLARFFHMAGWTDVPDESVILPRPVKLPTVL